MPRATVVNDLQGGEIGGTDTGGTGSAPIVPVAPPVVPVTPKIVSISLSPGTLTLTAKSSASLACIATLSDGKQRACSKPVLSTSNATIATVSGLTVTATSTAGTANLTVTAEGSAAKASLVVTVPPATVVGVMLTPALTQLPVNTHTSLYCTALLADGSKRACNAPVLSTKSAALLAFAGDRVTANSRLGTAVVIVTAEGCSAPATVVVTH